MSKAIPVLALLIVFVFMCVLIAQASAEVGVVLYYAGTPIP